MNNSCICISLRRATNTVTSYYDEALAEAGMSVNQFSLLTHIDEIAPCSTSQLAEQVMLERTTLTRNLKRLLTMAYITDTAVNGSRKHSYVLTDQGRVAVEKARTLWEQAQSNIKSQIGDQQIDALMKLLGNFQNL